MSDNITNIKKVRLNKVRNILAVEYKLFDSDNTILDKTAKYLTACCNLVEFYPDSSNDNKNLKIAIKLRQLCSIYDSLFLIRSRLDIAQIADADGILLDINSISPQDARKIINDDKIIGFDLNLINDSEFKKDYLKNLHIVDFIQCNNNIKNPSDVIIFNSSKIERLK